jgi:copper chaperone
MEQSFTVTGMTCGHCEKAVDRAIKQIDPQAKVKIDRPNNTVLVESIHPREEFSKAIAEEGYAVAK